MATPSSGQSTQISRLSDSNLVGAAERPCRRLLFALSAAAVYAFKILNPFESLMSPTPPETPAPKADAAAEAAPKKKRFGGKRVKIALIVVAVMAVQAVAAALLLPKGQATPASGQAAEAGHGKEESHAEKADNLVEAEVGSFSVSLEENNGILWNVSFKLFAAVSSDAAAHFSDAVGERYKARVKQAVVKVVRRSSIDDLRDPQLDLFKRNLKTEINNVLPERYVQEMIVADIRTMQQ
jgi:flagellar basal body-associated protein FliL